MSNIKTYRFLAIIFIIPIFFNRFFIGGIADTYEELPGLSLQYLAYFSEIIIILFYIFGPNGRVNTSLLVIIFMLIFFQLIQYLNYSDEGLIQWIYFFRALLIVISGYLFARYYFDIEIFTQVFLFFCKITAVVSLLSFVLYYVLGLKYQLHLGYGIPRVQGFLSEPSLIGTLLTPGILLYFDRKKYLSAALLAACVILTFSVYSYLILLFTTAFYAILNRSNYRNPSRLIAIFLGITIILTFLIAFPDNPVLQRMVRFGNSLSLFSIDDIEALRLAGLDRVWGFFKVFEEMSADSTLLLGYGLNTSSLIFPLRFGDIIEYGFFAYMIASYGVVFGVLVVTWLAIQVFNQFRINIKQSLLTLPMFIGILGNSAGGIVVYGFVLTCVLGVYFKMKAVNE